MAGSRPIDNEATLLTVSDETWHNLAQEDWMEAFRSHPRIGESRASGISSAQSGSWSAQEQSCVQEAGDDLRASLARGNRDYEKRFGHIFIVCASGKTAGEMLEILQRRLRNDPAAELLEAAEQQRQIIQIRLRKWLQE